MKAKPYLGITGFKTRGEVEVGGDICRRAGFAADSAYIPMFGYLVSQKRLADKEKEGARSPPANKLARLARATPIGYLPMMHYHTTAKDTLVQQIQELFSLDEMYASKACRAVQLNMDWPGTVHLGQILQQFPELQMVLQLPKRAMEGLSIDQIARRAESYDGLVQYVLIDPSGGLGVDFDLEHSLSLMKALDEALPTTRMGIAGGFDGNNVMERIQAIRSEYTESFCIDAEGKLREKIDEKDVLSFEKVRKYVQEAAAILLKPHFSSA